MTMSERIYRKSTEELDKNT